MPDFSTTLLRSLLDRATTLGSYVRTLQSSHARQDDGYATALEMFYRYTTLVVRQAEREWSLDLEKERRHDLLVARVSDFFEKENWFDQRFARGRQSDVPRALQTMARRELRGHGLNDHEPVLTVGPPDSFDTHRADLSEYLFHDLFAKQSGDLADLPRTRFAIISVPYIEGTRALWYPISIGHELAHVRLEAQRGRLPTVELGHRIDEHDSVLMDIAAQDPTGNSPDMLAHHLRRTLQLWVDEILCDLNAVRLYGPAGLSSIAEFLAVLKPADVKGPRFPSATHPPLGTRLRAMFHYLETGGEAIPSHLSCWREYMATSVVQLAPKAALLETTILGELETIVKHAATWGETFAASSRRDAIDFTRGELINGVPGGTYCLYGGASGERIQVADVVNAAWEARDAIENQADSGSDPGLLAAAGMDGHEQRLALDNLAGKAIDTLEFATQWRAAGGEVTNVSALVSHGANALAVSGLLSAEAIKGRLRSLGDDRIVVTPLFAGAIQDAGIDLRLSPDFIVFRHSATTAFDPLDPQQNPRRLQESVDKAWGEPFILHPGELVLASTLEYVVLPNDVAAQVVTRSSYGRLGLITATAVQVQPGSRGVITLELVNHGETPIALMPGARIAQLVMTHIPGGTTPAKGKYWFPVGPEFSKVQSDSDADTLRNITRLAYQAVPRTSSVGSGELAHRFELAGSLDEANFFQPLLQAHGLPASLHLRGDIPDGSEVPHNASLGGDAFSTVTYAVSAAGALRVLVSVLLKFINGIKRGVIVTIDADGEVKITSSRELPNGIAKFISLGGGEIEELVPQGEESDGVRARLLARLRELLDSGKRDTSD